jgi:subtilisin family serine protease
MLHSTITVISFHRMRSLTLAATTCCFTSGVCCQINPAAAEALGAAKPKPATIVWQSGNATVNALPEEFAQLYASLAALRKAGGGVATKKIMVKKGDSIEGALRDEGVYGGGAMPIQVDQYVCGLNPEVCKFPSSKPVWMIQPNTTIVVPDLQLEPVIVHRPAKKSAKDTLEGIIRDREGCPTFDDACLLYIKNLNRRVPGEIDRNYVGNLTVPTRAYRATIVLESPVAGDPLLLPGMAELRKQAVPAIRMRLFSGTASDGTIEGTRARVLKLIGYPTNQGAGFTLPSTGVTQVTVMDNSVDTEHCMLRNVKVFEAGSPPASTRPPCGGRADAQKARDHGTHVVGLIAAATDTEVGPGMNPRAMVNVMSMNVDQLTDAEYAALQYDKFGRLLNTPDAPDVVNMSFEYRPKGSAQNDLIWAAMKQQEGNTLFVAAAGNDGKMLSTGSECSVRPACQQAPNVITVGALSFDEPPTMHLGSSGNSNFGSAVHVGAPGSNIVSTIAMNRVGVLSGTSQAAPLVTGVASLLYLKDGKLRPAQVKNRIIYTSDLFPSLYTSMLGGRLNAERALDFERAYVKRKGKPLERLVLKDNPSVHFTDVEQQGKEFWIRFGQIRRLKFEAEMKHFVLYYTEDSNKDSGELLRRFVRLPSAKNIVFATEPGPAQPLVEVRFRDIEDYTAALVR